MCREAEGHGFAERWAFDHRLGAGVATREGNSHFLCAPRMSAWARLGSGPFHRTSASSTVLWLSRAGERNTCRRVSAMSWTTRQLVTVSTYGRSHGWSRDARHSRPNSSWSEGGGPAAGAARRSTSCAALRQSAETLVAGRMRRLFSLRRAFETCRMSGALDEPSDRRSATVRMSSGGPNSLVMTIKVEVLYEHFDKSQNITHLKVKKSSHSKLWHIGRLVTKRQSFSIPFILCHSAQIHNDE